MNPFAHFEQVIVINLPHKMGRRERVTERLIEIGADMDDIVFVDGVCPQDVTVPPWWCDPWTMVGNGKSHRTKMPVGAYGALMAHISALSDAHTWGCDSVLILEDDVVFCHGFINRMLVFMDLVPTDWDCVHLRATLISKLCEFVPLAPGVVRLRKGWSQVAVAYRGDYIKLALDELVAQAESPPPKSLDYRLSTLHADHHVYAADPALVGHESIDSDVKGGVRLSKRESCVDDVSGWSRSREAVVGRKELLDARAAAFGPA